MGKRRIERDDLYRLRIVGDARIAPDGSKVAYVVKTMDREKDAYTTNIYLWENGETRRYTFGEKDSCPRWSPDGAWLAFLSDRGAKAQIYVLPTRGGEARCLTAQKLGAGEPIWSPDARSIAFAGPVPYGSDAGEGKNGEGKNGEGKNGENGTTRTKVIDRALYKTDGAGFTHDRRSHIFVTPVAEQDAEVRQLTEGDYNDESPAWSPDSRHLAFAANRNPDWDVRPRSDIWIVPAGGGELRRVTAGDGRWSSPTFSPDSSGIAYLGLPIPDGEWPDYYPHPLLLYIHGGPATAYGESFFHELHWWSAQGYGVAYCNPHGSATYGRRFQESIRCDWGNRDYTDVMAFTDVLAALPWVDEHRLAAAGGSYGGFMINWIAGHTDRFAALCTQRSICNQVSQGGTSDLAPFRQHRRDGTPEGNPQLLWDQSPLKYASRVCTPTFILHQEQDHRCPTEQGEQWFAALKRQGVPTRFIRFPDESHGLSRNGTPSRRYDRLGYMREWFLTYV